ncbi:MAG TPA: hypothetical protein VF669_09625 [Tepidisphaeraceae bacterium]|jgi:hypothetical protein
MTRVAVVVLTVWLAAATVALAKQGVVKTRNGQTYEGDVEEKNDGLIVTSRGIQTRIAQRDVVSVVYPEDFDKQLADRRAKLAKDDVRGRMTLAREAFNNKRYTVTRDLMEETLTIDPNNTDAAELRGNAMAQIRLERMRRNVVTTGRAKEQIATTTTAPATTQDIADRRFLRGNDINTIRQFELQETETDVPIRFERDVKRRYAMKLSNRPIDQFLALTPMQQAIDILKNGAPEMRNDVRIMRDPQAMMVYRRAVQPYVLQNCSTSQCHGGPGGGKLVLFNPADSDQATYTNFFIMQAYNKKAQAASGIFGTGELQMIDRMNPARSLLLQYSIPQNVSEYDHPQVAGYRPPLRGQDDLRYRQLFAWVHDSINPGLDVPNYGINFPTPGGSTQPATNAASQPATTTPVGEPGPAAAPGAGTGVAPGSNTGTAPGARPINGTVTPGPSQRPNAP